MENVENNIKVSVIVITYNHEDYIRQSLDSILMQEVDFKYEILVGDDASSDYTADILKDYGEKYPEVFKIFLRKENLGGTRNSYELFKRARGEYVAVLEGDDFWIDNKKLQTQVDFLDNNREYGGCSCLFNCVDENGERLSESAENRIKKGLYNTDEIYTVSDYEKGLLPGQAGTMLFRNIFKTNVKTDILYKAHNMIGDFTNILFVLSMGNIYRLPKCMMSYRKVTCGKDSWTVIGANIYTFYEIFMYHTRLENFARRELKINIHATIMKSKVIFWFANDCFRCPTIAKKRLLKKMIRETKDKKRYFKILLEAKYLTRFPSAVLSMDSDEWFNFPYKKLKEKKWSDFFATTSGKEIILYGAGGGCHDFMNRLYGMITVKYIVDKNNEMEGKYLYGKRICSINKLDGEDKENTIIIITPGCYVKEIYELLIDKGFKHIFSNCYMDLQKPGANAYKKHLMNKDYIQFLS